MTGPRTKIGSRARGLAEARAFIADYEAARRAPFDRAERRLCRAAFAYSVAYTARRGHGRVCRPRRAATFTIARHGDEFMLL